VLVSSQKRLITLTAAVAFALFAAATFAKLSVGKGKALFVSDGFYYYSYTVSLVLDRDLDFSNQYQFIKETHRQNREMGKSAGLEGQRMKETVK
jgi:hypothetical protein